MKGWGPRRSARRGLPRCHAMQDGDVCSLAFACFAVRSNFRENCASERKERKEKERTSEAHARRSQGRSLNCLVEQGLLAGLPADLDGLGKSRLAFRPTSSRCPAIGLNLRLDHCGRDGSRRCGRGADRWSCPLQPGAGSFTHSSRPTQWAGRRQEGLRAVTRSYFFRLPLTYSAKCKVWLLF